MSQYVSAFMAFGKRFSLDVKIYGGRPVDGHCTNIQFESSDLDWGLCVELCENIIPRVVKLLSISPDTRDRVIGEKLSVEVEYCESATEVIYYLGSAIIAINSH